MKMDLGIAEQAARERRAIFVAFALAALVAIAAATVSPVGYRGAGWDDEQYLAAARCWVAQGAPCVPHSHWWTRWPLIAPTALFSALLGENRFSIELAPGIWWALALIMTGWVGRAWFGWRAGAISVALLGTAPAMAFGAFDLAIDIPELVLQLTALAFATSAYRRQSWLFAVAAGVSAGIAVQARDTSLLFLGASAAIWLTLDPEKRKILLWSIAGLVSAELVEMLVYAIGTGDPSLRWRLALAHTSVPSDQLPKGFHSSRGPLLNPDYMKSWKREMAIKFWWPVDPWLNLLASPRSAMLLVCGSLSVAVFGRRLETSEKRQILRLLGGAMLVACALIYVLAIDPKSRMFMSLYAALAISAGAVIAHAWRTQERAIAAVLTALPVVSGIYIMSQYPTSERTEARAREWVARYGHDIEIFHGAATLLALVPETHRLPSMGSGRRYLIANSNFPCAKMVDHRPGRPDGRVIDQVSEQGQLCLIEYLPVRPSVDTRSRRL